ARRRPPLAGTVPGLGTPWPGAASPGLASAGREAGSAGAAGGGWVSGRLGGLRPDAGRASSLGGGGRPPRRRLTGGGVRVRRVVRADRRRPPAAARNGIAGARPYSAPASGGPARLAPLVRSSSWVSAAESCAGAMAERASR